MRLEKVRAAYKLTYGFNPYSNDLTDYSRPELVTFEEVKELYRMWVGQDENLLFMLERPGDPSWGRKWIAVKCSKRGNDVYRWRVQGRIDQLRSALQELPITVGTTTNCLFVTLTDNPAFSCQKDAWEGIGVRWNRFLSNIKKRYGALAFVRSWESTMNGRPHVHALLIFESALFKTFTREGKVRIEEKDGIARFWDSNVDVQGARSRENVLAYITKEIVKHVVTNDQDDPTLALLWLFRKRSFSIGGRILRAALTRLDRSMHNSNRKLLSLDSFGLPLELEGVKWTLIKPVRRAEELIRYRTPGQKEGLWSYELAEAPRS